MASLESHVSLIREDVKRRIEELPSLQSRLAQMEEKISSLSGVRVVGRGRALGPDGDSLAIDRHSTGGARGREFWTKVLKAAVD